MTDRDSPEHRAGATTDGPSLLRLQPEWRFYRRFVWKLVPAIGGVAAMLTGLVVVGSESARPFLMLAIWAPIMAVMASLITAGVLWVFFVLQREHLFEASEEGIQVKLNDFDDLVPWDKIRDVCPRGEHVHLNTDLRLGSMELNFIDPALSDRLWRLHNDKVGYRRHD